VPLAGCGIFITFASLQGFGKCDSWRQWLNKCVRCISGFLGRCLRHSFGLIQPALNPRYIASGSPQQKTPFPNNSSIVTEVFTSPLHQNGSSIVACVFISAGTCLPNHCLSAIQAFRRHVTLLSTHLSLGLHSGIFPSSFPTKKLYAFLLPTFVLYTLLISSSLSWSF
jgi:hypothetical protein